ncbi:MAG: hypothetical protein IJO52_03745, partial [Clostridia bacterium]|nr:hypothetical protein [Clostridia bacterium]
GQLNIEKASIAINTVSYVAPDSDTDTKGAYKFTVTVKKGDKVGDKDVYTSAEFTANISVPRLNFDTADETIKAMQFTSAPIYNEDTAVAYVQDVLLADISSIYASAGYTFEVASNGYTAPTATEAGALEFDVAVYHDDANENGRISDLTMTIAAGEAPIIINFASPVIANYASQLLVTSSGATVPEESFEMVEDENALGGAYAKFSRLSGSPEFNFTFYPGKYGFPAIEDLENYPVVAYRYRAPNHGNYQIYYTTDVTVSGLGYQDFGPTLDVNEWNTHIHTMNPAGNSAGATGSPAWDGNVRNIRFDFFRNFSSDAVTLEIDYIGFFESIEQAQAFAIAPHLDSDVTEDDLYEEYSAMLESINDAASEVKYNKNVGFNTIGDAYSTLAQSIEGVPGLTITSFTPAVNGTADDIDGTNGEIKYRVAFAESINNGNIILSDEFTAVIVADVYTKGETTAEFRVETESEPAGLRFKTTFTKDWMNFFKENNITLTYGTLVGSADKLGDTELVHGVDNIADVKGVNIFANTETDLTYTAVITGIPVEEVNTDLTARAYVSYTYEYFDYTVYFDTVTVCLNDVLD